MIDHGKDNNRIDQIFEVLLVNKKIPSPRLIQARRPTVSTQEIAHIAHKLSGPGPGIPCCYYDYTFQTQYTQIILKVD